jgi:hypothetical protein
MISQLMLEVVIGEAMYKCKVLGVCHKRPATGKKGTNVLAQYLVIGVNGIGANM